MHHIGYLLPGWPYILCLSVKLNFIQMPFSISALPASYEILLYSWLIGV